VLWKLLWQLHRWHELVSCLAPSAHSAPQRPRHAGSGLVTALCVWVPSLCWAQSRLLAGPLQLQQGYANCVPEESNPGKCLSARRLGMLPQSCKHPSWIYHFVGIQKWIWHWVGE
jgi:hypothetical protein